MITHLLQHLIESYGYVAVLLIVMVESLGIPVPGETVLLIAAAFAASGQLSIRDVILSAAIGAVVGDAAGYWVGRLGGKPLILRFGKWLWIDETKLSKAQAFYDRHGGKTVFFGRFVALLRTFSAALAGVSRMNYGLFTAYNVLGGVCWSIIIGLLGFWFGQNLPKLHRVVGRVGLMLALLVALVVVLILAWRWAASHREKLYAWASAAWTWLSDRRFMRHLLQRHPRLLRIVGDRLSPTGYLGLHLTLGVLLSLGAMLFFADIVDDISDSEDLALFDQTVSEGLHRHATHTGVAIFKAITTAGSVAWIAGLAVIVAGILVFRRQWVLLSGWLVALIGGGLIDEGLKLFFRRPRPQWSDSLIRYQSWSFPSGHAIGSLIAYGMLAYLLILWLRQWRLRVAVLSVTVLLILAIGFSRLYLGAHFLTDVVGGYATGAVWLSACITGLEVARRRASPEQQSGK